MNNYIEESDFKYSEIAIALEDYEFNTIVKFTIPTIFTFLNNNSIVLETHVTLKTNLVNKDLINANNYTTCNYIELFVPFNAAGGNYKGLKGDKYIVIFVGGNINKCSILQRIINSPIIIEPPR